MPPLLLGKVHVLGQAARCAAVALLCCGPCRSVACCVSADMGGGGGGGGRAVGAASWLGQVWESYECPWWAQLLTRLQPCCGLSKSWVSERAYLAGRLVVGAHDQLYAVRLELKVGEELNDVQLVGVKGQTLDLDHAI